MMWQKKRPPNEESEPPAFSAGEPGAGDGATAMESHGIPGFLPSSWRHDWLLGFLLVAVTMIAYQPVWHAGFIWDDDSFLTDNPVIKSADGLCRLWFTASTPDYYPMTSSMLWLEWRLWANNPAGYHLVNVLLHSFSAVLLWRVLLRLKIPGSLLAAAIFALHPVNVESVAWITERKNTLCMFFYVGTLLTWLKFEDSGRDRWYGLALAGFVLALLSKTAVAPLPLVLLGIAWWRRGRLGWKDVLRAIPFFVIAAALGLVTVWFQYHQGIRDQVVRTDGFWPRLAGAGWAVWFYLYKAVLPLDLAFVYPRWQIDARNMLSYIPLVLLAAAFVLCWRCWRGWGKAVFFGLAYFVVMLLPILGFLNIYFMRFSLVADHWQYFAIIGPISLAAAMIRRPVLAAALLLALGALTWKQCGIYANSETLWQTTLRLNPNCWMAHISLGNVLMQRGQVDEAISHFQKALQSNPGYPEGHYNLGKLLLQEGRGDEAIPHLQKALQISPGNADAHLSLGNVLMQKGQVDEAISHFQTALQIRPDFAQARNNLGNALLQEGRVDEGISHLQKSLQINPGNAETQNNLGGAFLLKGQVDEAISHFQTALQIRPDFAGPHFNLGNALLQKGSVAEAISQYQKALQINPRDAKAQNNLAWLLATCAEASLRNGAKAVELARQANALTGGENPVVLHTLAAALAEAGRFPEAVETAQRALRVAGAQSNTTLAGALQSEMKLYQAGSPFHSPAQTH
jgi:tetratricopeptide (TPR) repeat protein